MISFTIAAGAKNTFMKCQVRIQPLLARPAVLHGHNRRLEPDQVLGGGLLGCPGREFRFDDAGLAQLMMGEARRSSSSAPRK